jgi:hypothetical protein
MDYSETWKEEHLPPRMSLYKVYKMLYKNVKDHTLFNFDKSELADKIIKISDCIVLQILLYYFQFIRKSDEF